MALPVFRTAPQEEESNSYWREYGHGVQVLQASRVGRPFSITRPVKADAFLVYRSGKLVGPLYTNFRDADRSARFLAHQWDQWEENPMKRYSRRNQLDTDTELILGGVVAVAVVGVIGYLIYKNAQPATTATAAASPTSSLDPTAQQLGIAAGTPGSYLSGTTDQYGNPIAGT